MKTVTAPLNAEEEKAFKKYADFKNHPLSTVFKQSLKEKIEYEIDLKALLEYEEHLEAGETEYIDFDDIKRKMNMWGHINSKKKGINKDWGNSAWND